MMKKVLLLLFLFLCVSVNAQIPPLQPPPLFSCDDNNDGFGLFDLASRIPSLLNGLNPATTQISFHETEVDSQNNTNPISNLISYVNITPNNQRMYVRIVDDTNSNVYHPDFDLIVNPLPNAGTDGAITVCETSTTAINLYSLITGEQSGGTWTWVTGTGGTFNAAAGTYTSSVGATTSTFTYTITGNVPCINDSSVATVSVMQQPNAGTDGTLTVCDASTTTIDLFSLITGEQAGGTWTRATGTGGTFNAAAGTYTPAVGATTSIFSYTITGTAPCFNDSSIVIISINCNPPPPSVVCGGTFTDNGGASANYANNSNQTTTICPTTPGDVVKVTFTSFNTEASWDALYVYDGNTVNPATQLPSAYPVGNVPGGIAGGYWGNLTGVNLPGPFISASPNGCLTFVFRSDANNTLEGWVANVSCITLPSCPAPTTLVATTVTDSSFILNWTNTNGSMGFIFNRLSIVPQGEAPSITNSIVVNAPQNIYTLTGLSPEACYSVYLKKYCSTSESSEWSEPLNICMSNCANSGDCSEALILNAFLDSNNNGVKDVGETNFNQGNFVYQVNDSTTNQYGTSNNGSYYIFDSNPANSYDINFAINSELNAYYTSAVSYTNVTLSDGSGANYLYFPVVNILPHVDAQVSLSPYGQPRPGFTYTNYIYYQNNGLQTIANGTLTYTHAPNVSISFVSQSGVTTTSNGFTYDFTNLAPNESRYIYVTLSVPTIPTVNLGDLITNSVTIQITGDINPTNNSSSITQTIVGSYDPNDKMESHGGKIVHANFTSNDYLYYTIQFENTGSANAEFIRVQDALDNQLDENTFEMINASHNVNTKRVGNQLTWHFYDINLPPTATNPNDSHGYIHFRIRPKPGYAIGDIIPNTASIYFDYNPAIVTNTFTTEFVQALGNSTFNADTISLYPNPTTDRITITNSGSEKILKLAIYDVTGKRIYTLNHNLMNVIAVDVSQFAKGIYLVELTSDNNSKITKKLILK